MKDLKILHPNHCSTAPETLMRPIWWWKTLKKFKKWCSQIVFPPFSRQDGFLATWDPYKMKDLKILHLNHCSTAPETLMRPCLCRFKVSNFMFFYIFFSHHLPNGGSSFSITHGPRLTTSTSPHALTTSSFSSLRSTPGFVDSSTLSAPHTEPKLAVFGVITNLSHLWIRRQFYTFSTSYWPHTSAQMGDYRSVPRMDSSTVLHFQHLILTPS